MKDQATTFPETSARKKPRGSILSRLLYFLVGLMVLVIAVFAYMTWCVYRNVFGYPSPRITIDQYAPKNMLGDLGGMKVNIPRHYAEYVEYDGDSVFVKKRKEPLPERTFDSRLKGFGINVRFPNMEELESKQLRKERDALLWRKKNWLSITINAGEIYPGDGFLDKWTDRVLFNTATPENIGHWHYTYERIPEDEYGLEVWRLSMMDPRTNKPARESSDTMDVYIHRDETGKVDAHVSCGRPSVLDSEGICHLGTSLQPKAQAWVYITFRRGLLPEWSAIRHAVRDLLFSFEVKPSSADSPSFSPSVSR